MPEQPEGFLAGVPADLDAVINVIVERVVDIHEKYVLVAMYPKGPVIPNPITELVARSAGRADRRAALSGDRDRESSSSGEREAP